MLDLPVPPPGPAGPFGTMAWLRATVSRFSNGAVHERRRALAEAQLAGLDPSALRAAASRASVGVPDLAYVPVEVLARATRVTGDVVDAVRTVAAAYHPGTDAPGADDALAQLLAALPEAEPEAAAQHVALLVQACEATAALVRGGLERPLEDVLRDSPPVPATKRLAADGAIVAVSLDGLPFGAGPRRCPGEAHARALAAGVIEGARDEHHAARPAAGAALAEDAR